MPTPRTTLATCLGCGCACDDIAARIESNQFVSFENACALGRQWFGDGRFPAKIRCDGSSTSIEEALAEAAARLGEIPASLLILVGDDLAVESHRKAIALADWLGASIDGVAAETVAAGMLAAARHGRVSGTLGELRGRCDLVLWWGCDPSDRYPRFVERFIEAPSRYVKRRRQIAIDIGGETGPPDVAERLAIAPDDERDLAGLLRARLAGRLVGPRWPAMETLVQAIELANSVGIIYDAEPNDARGDSYRTESLIRLGQQLFETRRAAVWGLRAGGNRNGFEAALTWQTGFAMSVDFAAGYPAFTPRESVVERLARGRYARALVLGTPGSIPAAIRSQLGTIETIAIGPFASAAPFHPAIAIDTGRVGIHAGGLALRMDDVPLEIDALLEHPRNMDELLSALTGRVCPVPRMLP